MELSDSMILQMLGEASAAERRAGEDALTIGCTPQQVYEIELGARCETIRSYLYQAGILSDISGDRDPIVQAFEAGRTMCIEALQRAIQTTKRDKLLPLQPDECVTILQNTHLPDCPKKRNWFDESEENR